MNTNPIWCEACGAAEFTPCSCPATPDEGIELQDEACAGCAAGAVGGPAECICEDDPYEHRRGSIFYTHLVDDMERRYTFDYGSLEP